MCTYVGIQKWEMNHPPMLTQPRLPPLYNYGIANVVALLRHSGKFGSSIISKRQAGLLNFGANKVKKYFLKSF